jgi:hypothetical protein
MRAIGTCVAEFNELDDAMLFARRKGRQYSVIGGVNKPWGVGKWITLSDDEIRAVVNPPPAGERAIANAAQAAMLVESDREHA